MASPFDLIDISDPCALAPILRKLVLELASGAAVARARLGDDDIEFSRGDLGRLERMAAQAEDQCAALSGKRPWRRRALRAGFRGL